MSNSAFSLGIQQGTRLLVSAEAHSLLEKRITKGMPATKEMDSHIYVYQCVVCVYMLLVPQGNNQRHLQKDICKDAYKVRVSEEQKKKKKAKQLLDFQTEPAALISVLHLTK